MRKRKGPWIITGTKVIYRNPWIKVREDKVIRPDGKEGVFGVVSMDPGVTILPLDSEGNIYLIKEYRYAIERVTIGGVSGGIDGKETKLQAAKRELKEETGLIAKKWTCLGFVDPLANIVTSPNYMYLAQELTQSKAEPEGAEVIEVIKIPFRKAVEWVEKNKITHSASVILILKTENYLNKIQSGKS